MRILSFFLIIWMGCTPLTAAGVDAIQPNVVKVQSRHEITEVGDSHFTSRLAFSLRDYNNVKRSTPNSYQFLQEYNAEHAVWELLPGAKSGYDDASSSVVMDFVCRGAVYSGQNDEWVANVGLGYDFVDTYARSDGVSVVQYYKTWNFSGLAVQEQIQFILPKGASTVRTLPGNQGFAYILRAPAHGGEPRLSLEKLMVKERLMSCTYKVYGLAQDTAELRGQWLAKSVFANTGTGAVKNLRMRYKVSGYSEWSAWQKYANVLPGQTIVSLYYPVLGKETALLRSNTPVDVLLEYTYEDGQRKLVEETESARTVLLGVNSFIFSSLMTGENYGSWKEDHNNAPLLAAWVTRNDPVIREFAALANKNAGGLGATSGDKEAWKVLESCYNLLRQNDFTYQHPDGFVDKSVSYDEKMIQNVKLPRDVVRDRSGTCIDLAILYAAMANEVGLEPYLMLLPGHCMPVIKLPSGNWLPVEVTGVGGGFRAQTGSFESVVAYGQKEFAEVYGTNKCYLVNVRSAWTMGISNPELEKLPDDILQRWGIKQSGGQTLVSVTNVQNNNIQPIVYAPSSSAEPAIPSEAHLARSVQLGGRELTSTVMQVVRSAGTGRGWSVVQSGQSIVVLRLVRHGYDTTLYIRCQPSSVEFYSHSIYRNIFGRTERKDPESWIENLVSDLRDRIR